MEVPFYMQILFPFNFIFNKNVALSEVYETYTPFDDGLIILIYLGTTAELVIFNKNIPAFVSFVQTKHFAF